MRLVQIVHSAIVVTKKFIFVDGRFVHTKYHQLNIITIFNNDNNNLKHNDGNDKNDD